MQNNMNLFRKKPEGCPEEETTATGFGILSSKEQKIFSPLEPKDSKDSTSPLIEILPPLPSTGRHTKEYLETSDPLVVFFLDYYGHSCKLPSPFVDECIKLAIALRNNFTVAEK